MENGDRVEEVKPICKRSLFIVGLILRHINEEALAGDTVPQVTALGYLQN